jgi:hypothetical protein
MMDYISDMHDVDHKYLEMLSDISEKEIDNWKKDLTEIGVW